MTNDYTSPPPVVSQATTTTVLADRPLAVTGAESQALLYVGSIAVFIGLLLILIAMLYGRVRGV